MKSHFLSYSLCFLITVMSNAYPLSESGYEKVKTKAKQFSENVKDQTEDALDSVGFKLKKGVKSLFKQHPKNDFSIQSLPDNPPAEWPQLASVTIDGEKVDILKADIKGWKKLFKVIKEYQKKDKLHDLYTKYYDYFLMFYKFPIFIRSIKVLEERFWEFLAPLFIDYYNKYHDTLKEEFDFEKLKPDFPPKFWPQLDKSNVGKERQTSEVKRTDHVFKATFENWNKFVLMVETYQGKHEELRGKKKPTLSDLFKKYDVYFKTIFDPAKDYDFFRTTISGIGKKNREVMKQCLDAYYNVHLKNKRVDAYKKPEEMTKSSGKEFNFVGLKEKRVLTIEPEGKKAKK